MRLQILRHLAYTSYTPIGNLLSSKLYYSVTTSNCAPYHPSTFWRWDPLADVLSSVIFAPRTRDHERNCAVYD